jgi:O-antigen/teichoic acid export membrane protein
MPKYLSTTEIGVIRQIQNYALFISSFLALGVPQTVIRMFPHFKNEQNKNHGILSLVWGVFIFSSVLFLVLFHFFGVYFLSAEIEKSDLFKEFYPLIGVFTISTLLFTMLDSYATANKESTIGTFAKDFALRVFVIAIVAGFAIFDWLNYQFLIASITYIQFIPPVIIILFLAYRKKFPLGGKISFPSIKLRNEFLTVSSFGWFNVLSSVAVISIDTIMLGKFVDLASVGIYTTVVYFSSLMLIPNKSLGKITTSVIAENFKLKNFTEIKKIYRETTLSLFIMGLFILINTIIALPIIFTILPYNEFGEGKWVLVIMAIVNLIKMGTGVKFIIISNSKFYKWTTYLFTLFVVLIILTNWVFIPKYGMTGAAVASLIATTIFHAFGLVFVKIKFGYWPFSITYVKASSVGFVLGLILYFIPNFDFPILSSILKSITFSSIFMVYIIQSRIFPKLNDGLNKYLKINTN